MRNIAYENRGQVSRLANSEYVRREDRLSQNFEPFSSFNRKFLGHIFAPLNCYLTEKSRWMHLKCD